MENRSICAGVLFFISSFFLQTDAQFTKADVMEDVVINYNSIRAQVNMLISQKIEEGRKRLAAAERLDCLIMLERYKIKLLHIDGELKKIDYSEYSRKYHDLFKRLNRWKYGQ